MLNVFDDQKFLLRRISPSDPLGERLKLSFRELMTRRENDGPLRFDYPLEYMNIAALGLCTALTQAAFEPIDVTELSNRLEEPFTDEEFDRGIAAIKDLFTIDGPSRTRFMQGPEPNRDAKGRFDGGPVSELLLTVKKGDKTFLNRPIREWVVGLDQIPLLLFSRATFYEKSAGRGYLTGTSGDLEIRTFLVDSGSLHRTIWLNVLTRDAQRQSGNYTDAGTGEGYDGWMWHQMPKEDVPQGLLSLRSGLFWTVANAWIDIKDIPEPRSCVVTGEMISGRVGTAVAISATGIGYGVKVTREKGPEVRQSFFRHPNGPYRFVKIKENDPYPKHYSVSETSGLIGTMGGLFFAGKDEQAAPVVNQLYSLNRVHTMKLKRSLPPLNLECFGFHMLSSKQNIHGGYEYERFHYPVVGLHEEDVQRVLSTAQSIMVKAVDEAMQIERLLAAAIQRCTLVQTDTKDKDGRFEYKPKTALPPENIIPDIAKEFWSRVGVELRVLLEEIAQEGATVQELKDASDRLKDGWKIKAGRHAIDLFTPIFNDYSASPTHLAAAHKARGYLYGTLRNRGISLTDTINRELSSTAEAA